MYLLGTLRRPAVHRGRRRNDLDFFPFPMIDPKCGQDAVEAPIDGFMMAKKPKNVDGAKELLEYLGTADGAEHLPRHRPQRRRREHGAPTPRLQRRCRRSRPSSIGGAKHIAQFLDRDTRPDFASTVMIPALQKFLNDPERRRRPASRASRSRRRRSSGLTA